jgi:tRNA (cytidine/uridine-2'-O-)-methyltransferase
VRHRLSSAARTAVLEVTEAAGRATWAKSMFDVALLEPEVPPNTGNIIRVCVATGSTLHLIGRLGFPLGDRAVRRAAVDHMDEVRFFRHASLEAFEADRAGARVFAFSARAATPYTRVRYQPADHFLFGCESQGLPESVVRHYAERALCIPMPSGRVRSLNLANAVAIVVYEALRQVEGW